jgi:alpha-glucuronidase
MVEPGLHYGANPEGYEFSRWGTYHRANKEAIGIDRTRTGTEYTRQYPRVKQDIFEHLDTCPENIVLFFHRLRYDFIMENGNTLLQNIYDTHFSAYEDVLKMVEKWKALENTLGKNIYTSVYNRFLLQIENARNWRDVINTYFYRKTAIKDKKGRLIYE